MTEHRHRQPGFAEHLADGDTRRPELRRIIVTEVRFNRGEGCCTDDPTRMVTAYYDDDGRLLAEHDPHPTSMPTGGQGVWTRDGAPVRYRCRADIPDAPNPDGPDCDCTMFRLDKIILSADGGNGNVCECGHRYDIHDPLSTGPRFPSTTDGRPITDHSFIPIASGPFENQCGHRVASDLLCGQLRENHQR